ncbi:MAG: hypothetical protein AAF664_10015 [Planctomycetota bacterium]
MIKRSGGFQPPSHGEAYGFQPPMNKEAFGLQSTIELMAAGSHHYGSPSICVKSGR